MNEDEKPYAEILKILKKKDTTLKAAIESVKVPIQPEPSVDIYFDLLQSIVSQQLSVSGCYYLATRFKSFSRSVSAR